MSITLEIPDISKALHSSPEEKRLKLELAVSLYAQNVFALGQAARVAGMSRLDLNDVLAERGLRSKGIGTRPLLCPQLSVTLQS
jgi:predicted HTH domain antitoxin